MGNCCVRRIIVVRVIIGVIGILHAVVDDVVAVVVNQVADFACCWVYGCIGAVAVVAIGA